MLDLIHYLKELKTAIEQNSDLIYSHAPRHKPGGADALFPADFEILPASDNTYDLGSSSYRWRNLWVNGVVSLGTKNPLSKLDIRTPNTDTAPFQVRKPGWDYRVPITIDNTSNSNDLSDYQVLIVFDSQTLISEGKMRQDCGDIRFTDSDGVTKLSYWIEGGCNTNKTKVWVKVPLIPANSMKTIYMYYGNLSASSKSDGKSTFVIYDDFNDNTIDPSWKTVDADNCDGTNFSESGGEMQITAGGVDTWGTSDEYASVYQSVDGDFVATVKVVSQENTSSWAKAGIMVRNDMSAPGSSKGYVFMVVTPGNGWAFQYDPDDDGYLDGNKSIGTTSYPNYIKLVKHGTEFTGYYSLDGENWTEVYSTTLSSANSIQDVGMSVTSHAGSTLCLVKFDNFIVRKYTKPEPEVNIGTEEVLAALYVQSDTGNVGIGTTNPTLFTLQVAGDVGPDSDNYSNLGSSSNRWKNLYLSGQIIGDKFQIKEVLVNTTSNRPSAGVQYRLFISTDEQIIYLDNGSEWIPLGAVYK
ncbi:DUF2341 domain-containing protein [bacterium]|nr:DUF2341 domain-containing protein [bacterium]